MRGLRHSSIQVASLRHPREEQIGASDGVSGSEVTARLSATLCLGDAGEP
ncbi:hypothetical protein GCM10010403_10900 [Glycomyces rutgersensis]|uniref:Uncharacterized protein n=1 Tax=Glycomyces rutgersensis TaxID=58115 RepID=A0ABN3F904_9ACTN